MLGRRDSDWPQFVWTVIAQGHGGWVPAALFDAEHGPAVALSDYDTRELDAQADATLKADLEASEARLQALVDSAEKNNVHFDQLIAADNAEGQQLVRDAIAALVKQTGAIEQAAAKLGISDLNPDTADHEF